MKKTKANTLRYYVKWILWILLIQFFLANISASIYAYKFTHFYNNPAPAHTSQNIFHKTWKLFVGPTFYKNTDEPPPSFSYVPVTLKTSDNISIDAWYSTVDSSKGCIIFVHGYSVNKSIYDNEATLFKQWGYNVLLIDLRNHGKSGGNVCTLGIKETDEVQKAVEFAQAQHNRKIILYGGSLGAGICIKAVSDGKIAPAAIIADMPFGTLHNHFKARAKDVGFPSEPFATLVTLWIGIERGYNGFKHDVSSYAKNIKCPVLVEWGSKDSFVKRNELDKIYNNLASVNKKLVVYPNAGHESFLRNDPVKWQKEMQAFLNSLQ